MMEPSLQARLLHSPSIPGSQPPPHLLSPSHPLWPFLLLYQLLLNTPAQPHAVVSTRSVPGTGG